MRAPRALVVRLACTSVLVVAAGWSGALAYAPAKVRLDVGETTAAFDSPIQAEISGLTEGEQVTVRALAHDLYGRLWTSWARFTADSSGRVDLAHALPQAGTYRVADAGGLLWSLEPTYTTDPAAEFSMNTATGFDIEVRVVVDGTVVAEDSLTRQASPTRPQKLTVSQVGFDGTLYLPRHAAPDSSAVIVIGGSDGGEPDPQAIALADAGHPALALAYFGEPALPSCLCSIPLEYFAHAVTWLRTQPAIAARPVVLIGTSRGAEAALAIASYKASTVDAVIANSPTDRLHGAYGPGAVPGTAAWTLDGKPLDPGTRIPAAEIRVPVLLSDGGQDLIWDSAEAADNVMHQLDEMPGAPAHADLYYPDAGHAVAGFPPYFPLNDVALGGTPAMDALAAEHYWPQLLQFLDQVQRRPAV